MKYTPKITEDKKYALFAAKLEELIQKETRREF